MVPLPFASTLLILLVNHGFPLGLASPAPELITVSGRQRSQAVCCTGNKVKSCLAATIHPEALTSPRLTLPTGVQVEFMNNIGGNMNAYHYESEDAYAIIVYNPRKGAMHGHAKLTNNTGYSLEYCGDAGHVWKEMDMKAMRKKKHDGVERKQRAVDKSNYGEFGESKDNTTMVTYSVKFYYTNEYDVLTADIPGQVELYVAETNQAYANSLVPLKVEAICIEKATLPENIDTAKSNDILDWFTDNLKSSPAAVRGSADVAHLMISDSDTCGLAWMDTIWDGKTLGLTDKNCALDNTIGHEIGHNIGLAHDPAQGANEFYSYATGHQIEQGKADKETAYHTVMAYDDANLDELINQVVVPYYSNPDVIFPKTGTPTGKAGVSHNAALLLLNRFALSSVGDESEKCTGATLAPPATPAATTTAKAPTTTLKATTTAKAPETTPKATTTASGSTDPASGCKPCKEVTEGDLKGTYKLLRSGDFEGCPVDQNDGCVYVRDGLEYCFKKGGFKTTYC